MPSYRHLTFVLTGLHSGAASAAADVAAAEGRKPNVLSLFSDDKHADTI